MLQLVDYTSQFLELSWQWLNDPEMKKLTMTKDFTKEDQLKFFSSLHLRNDYWIKGMMYDGLPIGVMGIKNIRPASGEYWGYIGDKRFWGKGLGASMLEMAVAKGRELSLRELHLRVAGYNERAKSLYKRFGFVFISSEDGIENYSLSL